MKVRNLEIFQAREPLQKLMEVKLPVRASAQIAKLALALNGSLKVIDDVRNGLVKKYGEEKDGETRVEEKSESFQKFIEEFNELMEMEEEVKFEKVKLPETVAATCDKCNHNMDKPFEVEPSVLMALEKFVEI